MVHIKKLGSKGFTLIELLAVIVVLAIIMLLAVQAVLPLMTSSRKNAFAIEANQAIAAAQTYIVTDTLINGTVIGTSGTCVKIEDLVKEGHFDADSSYKGYVKVRQKEANSNLLLYEITMSNGKYKVKGGTTGSGASDGIGGDTNVDIKGTDVVDGTTFDALTGCPSS